MGVFPLLKYLLPVVVAFLLPATDPLDHGRVWHRTHRHGLLQKPIEELPARSTPAPVKAAVAKPSLSSAPKSNANTETGDLAVHQPMLTVLRWP